MDLFPSGSLTPKQTVIVGELLRDHPHGQVINYHGRPVFISEEGCRQVMIPLSVVDKAGRHHDHSDQYSERPSE